MATAKRDGNRVPTLIASSSADGLTPIVIQESMNILNVLDNTTGSDHGNDSVKDPNRIPVLFCVSSSDGITPIAVYADAGTNSLLIKST